MGSGTLKEKNVIHRKTKKSKWLVNKSMVGHSETMEHGGLRSSRSCQVPPCPPHLVSTIMYFSVVIGLFPEHVLILNSSLAGWGGNKEIFLNLLGFNYFLLQNDLIPK